MLKSKEAYLLGVVDWTEKGQLESQTGCCHISGILSQHRYG